MQAGKLDRRIIIEQVAQTEDTFGDLVDVWTTFATVWASVIVKGGGESFTENQTAARRVVVFKIRYLAGVNERMRVSYNSLFYDILGPIKELGRLEGQEFDAEVFNP